MADLISVARARQALTQPPRDETVLSTLIAAASRAIENCCGRTFVTATYDERISGAGDGTVWLRHFPITGIERVAIAWRPALRVRNEDAGHQRASVAVSTTGLSLTLVTGATATTDTSIAWGVHSTIGAVAAAVTALGNGWTANALDEFAAWPATELVPVQGPLHCLSQPATIRVYGDDLDDFVVDPETGELRGAFPKGCRNIRVIYQAGYATVPEDVQEACARLVAYWLAEGAHDPAVYKERTGQYYFSRRPQPAGALPHDVRNLLAPYRDLRLV